MTEQFEKLMVRQLDEALSPFQALRERRPPRDGWARAIREALGMSQRQLAERMGVSTTAAQSAERNEARGKIQLDSLDALADGLDCELVYALVPRQSIQSTLEHRAKELAGRVVRRVSTSMELEEQGVPEEEKRRQIEELAAGLLRERPQHFWEN
ncbi:MAG: mobile mystery protein A [Gemmatimonadetes bacterium]|nr:mobile mystery protein A [Gemmatimonadota bacterium]